MESRNAFKYHLLVKALYTNALEIKPVQVYYFLFKELLLLNKKEGVYNSVIFEIIGTDIRMEESAYNIKLITVRDLNSFINSYVNDIDKDDILPITVHKAKCIAANPCASENDVALVLAYDQQKCIGYLGLIADKLTTTKGVFKINWMSGWYISPEYQGKRIGSLLVKEAKKTKSAYMFHSSINGCL